jgi:Protein of unknown function (DUF1059)
MPSYWSLIAGQMQGVVECFTGTVALKIRRLVPSFAGRVEQGLSAMLLPLFRPIWKARVRKSELRPGVLSDLFDCCHGLSYNSPRGSFVHSKEANMSVTRKVIDCRRFPAEKPCSIAISGAEDEVVELGVLHATTVHGHQDTPELREQLRSMLQDESTTTAEAA